MSLGVIEALNLLLCAGIAIILSVIYRDAQMVAGLVLGTLVWAANFRLLRFTVTKVVEGVAGDAAQNEHQEEEVVGAESNKGGLVFIFFVKIFIFYGIIWLILRSGWVSIGTFIIGLGLIVGAIIIETIRYSLRGSADKGKMEGVSK